MEYSIDIFNKNPERLALILAQNCRIPYVCLWFNLR